MLCECSVKDCSISTVIACTEAQNAKSMGVANVGHPAESIHVSIDRE